MDGLQHVADSWASQALDRQAQQKASGTVKESAMLQVARFFGVVLGLIVRIVTTGPKTDR